MMVTLSNGVEFSINERFKQELDICLSDVKHDEMDLVIPITGPEGWGKSRVARGIGLYAAKFLNSKFDVDDIDFTLKKYIKASVFGGAFKINVLDEGRKVLGRGKRDADVEMFLDYISECRAKRQIHLICVPAYHDLKAYVALWRCPMVIELRKNHEKDDTRESGFRMRRGEYRVHTNKDALKYCYEHPYQYPKNWAVRDWWSPKEVFTPEQLAAYNAKKDYYTIEKYGKEKPEKVTVRARAEVNRDIALRMVKEGVSKTDIARYLSVNPSAVTRYCEVES